MTDSPAKTLSEIKRQLAGVILGKDEALDHVLVALLAGQHLLLEDVPGVGKTTLAKALARCFAGEFRRVQFTPDLLPADILGSSVYSPRDGSFSFKEGPVFANVLLADEINRASPRTQSALLEAMSEGQVSSEGVTRALPVGVPGARHPEPDRVPRDLPAARGAARPLRSADRPRLPRVGGSARGPLRPGEAPPPGVGRGRWSPRTTCVALQRQTREVTVERSLGRYVIELARGHAAPPRGEAGLLAARER